MNDSDDQAGAHRNNNEPVLMDVLECQDEAYAAVPEMASPKTMKIRKVLSGVAKASLTDRACNVAANFLLFAILLTSFISIVAGACCLASLAGKEFNHFPFFFALGVLPLVIGIVCLLLAIFVIFFTSFYAMGLTNYGMCFYGTSRRRGALRVCLLGVFPFVILIILLALCILGFTIYSLSQQLPPLDKNYIEIDGLSGPILIVRDDNGLTHIKASSRRDAYVGQGFAEAQDRLFQLEFHRLVGKGELSTTVGSSAISTDRSIRTLNLRKAAYAMCRVTDPAYIDFYQAFADGVNVYLTRVSKRPVEFFFMSTRPLRFHDPEPFSAKDLCLTSRLFQWQMSANLDKEGMRFAVWAGTNRTYAQAEEIYPDFTNQPNTVLSSDQMLALMEPQWNTSSGGSAPTPAQIATMQSTYVTTNEQTQAYSAAAEGAVYDYIIATLRSQIQASANGEKVSNSIASSNIASFYLGGKKPLSYDEESSRSFREMGDRTVFAFRYIHASNAWAARDASGNAMAASDPHLTINQPSLWYYVHLSFPTSEGIPFSTAGVGLIGLPGVHIGKTSHVAWGITMSMTDLQDLFVFPPTSFSGLPDNAYMYAGQQRMFVDRVERIKVKGGKDVVVNVQDSILGPIVTEMLGLPSVLKTALFAVTLREDDNSSIVALMGASDPAIDTAEKMMNNFLLLRSPGFSIPIADVKGNIAYTVTGQHPLRPLGHTGLFPTLAFDGPDMLCRIIMTMLGTPAADGSPCSLASALSTLSSRGIHLTSSSIDLRTFMPLIRSQLQRSNWSTYIPVDADAAFNSIPSAFVPHVSIPFDGSAANISCANQKVVPQGYPYSIGADYAWPYRGARMQEMLASNGNNLSSQAVHMAIQLDHQSNMWTMDFKAIVSDSRFTSGVADNELASYWVNRLLNWDATASLGSVETAFFWRWLQRMAILPRDVLAARKMQHWHPMNRYLTRMLTTPSTRMTAECADYQQNWASAFPCWDFAIDMFKAEAVAAGKNYKERWGIDLNRLHGLHELLSTTFLSPVFQREISKSGDCTSVAVSDHSVDGAMPSTQASSMRQLFDLWNATHNAYFQMPGGNSGNPYSKYYDNLLQLFAKEEYLHVPVDYTSWNEIHVAHSQTLSA